MRNATAQCFCVCWKHTLLSATVTTDSHRGVKKDNDEEKSFHQQGVITVLLYPKLTI